jgi:hypothetical protein
MNSLKILICEACQGWGHKTNDGYGSKYKFCFVNKIIDVAFNEAADTREFNKTLKKKDKAPSEKLGLKMSSSFLKRMVLVKEGRNLSDNSDTSS